MIGWCRTQERMGRVDPGDPVANFRRRLLESKRDCARGRAGGAGGGGRRGRSQDAAAFVPAIAEPDPATV